MDPWLQLCKGQHTVNNINNPLTQLAILYQKLEEQLRYAPQTVGSLNILLREKYAKSPHQIRDCVDLLEKRGHLNVDKSDGRIRTYSWNKESGAFVFGQFTQRKQQPSVPKVIKPATQPAPTPRNIEIVIDNILITVGKNPLTGNIRVTIGD